MPQNIMEELFADAKWYSRTGRSTAPGIKINILTKAEAGGSRQRGQAPYLGALEDEMENNNAAPRPREADRDMLCSSPRHNPGTVMKHQMWLIQGKQEHFRDTLLNMETTESDEALPKPNPVATLQEKVKLLREQSRKKVSPNAAFLAVARENAYSVKLLQGPPVGHYRPRFEAVEEALHVPTIHSRKHTSPRTRRSKSVTPAPSTQQQEQRQLHPSTPSPSAHYSLGTATPLNSSAQFLPVGSGVAHPASPAGLSETLGSVAAGKTNPPGAAAVVDAALLPKPTWPFASKTRGHELRVTEPYYSTTMVPFVNTGLTDNAGNVKLAGLMSRQMGRISTPAVQNDLIYDVAPSAARTPSVNLRRQPPRQPPARKPRTWEDIPRTQADVDTEAADKIKYSRSPTPLLSKGLSRNDEWLGVRSPLKDTYEHTMASPDNDGTLLGKSADAVFRSSTGTRSCSVDLSRSKRNFSKETPALDLVYDVDHSGVEKHVPAAVIKKDIFTKPSSLSANASPELGAYSVDLLHSKVVHNVSLAGMSSRQQQSKSGRTSPAPLTEAQHKFYDTHKDHAPLPSSPKIALGLSREQRAKVIHAAKPFVDVIYDYSVETGKKSASGKGNLDFGRALDREHRGPSRADL